MIGWLVGLVYNAVADLVVDLPGKWAESEIRKLRRAWFNRPGRLYQTPEALVVYLDEFRHQDMWVPLVDKFNRGCHRLPWLENRRVVLSLSPPGRASPSS